MMMIRTIILMITCFCGAIMVCCVFPAVGNKVIDGFELIVNRRKMYREYLQRLNDYEEYSPYMEKCEKKHQEKWLIDIQERAEKERKEYWQHFSRLKQTRTEHRPEKGRTTKGYNSAYMKAGRQDTTCY